jgi:hypothetical protein
MTPVIYKVHGVGYIVESESVPGAWRLVEGAECSCPATTPNCRHLRAVQALVREEDRRHARPVAPVHVSAMVD